MSLHKGCEAVEGKQLLVRPTEAVRGPVVDSARTALHEVARQQPHVSLIAAGYAARSLGLQIMALPLVADEPCRVCRRTLK